MIYGSNNKLRIMIVSPFFLILILNLTLILTLATNNVTIDCLRMFYSDEWNKGYVEDLAKFCHDHA